MLLLQLNKAFQSLWYVAISGPFKKCHSESVQVLQSSLPLRWFCRIVQELPPLYYLVTVTAEALGM